MALPDHFQPCTQHEKNQYETVVNDFSTFFNFIDTAPDIPVSPDEENDLKESFEEAKVACMAAGMIMCLDRMQRLVYIVGEVFEIDHNLASDIFETTPDTFRQRLTRSKGSIPVDAQKLRTC